MLAPMRFAAVLLALVTVACGGSSSPSSPSPTPTPVPAPTPAPAPTTVSLSGVVTSQAGARLPNITVEILDTANVGRKATTDAQGAYSLTGLTSTPNCNVAAYGTSYIRKHSPQAPCANTLNFALQTEAPWTATGGGNTVFDMPTYITRVRITGRFNGFSSNFIVRVGGRLVVNELLGTGWSQTSYDGTHLVTGGVVEITNSSGVSWDFREVR